MNLAEQSDVAVVVAGLYEAEARDRGELDLPTEQDELIDAVSRGEPAHDRRAADRRTGADAVDRPESTASCSSTTAAPEQGRALADVLFGDVNPSGKLPISIRVESQPDGARHR